MEQSEALKIDRKTQLKTALAKSTKIVAAYGTVLSQEEGPGLGFHPESDLPFSKAEIRAAIERQLLIEKDNERRASLEVSNVFLNDFIPDDEYRIVSQQQARLAQALNRVQAGKQDMQAFSEMILAGTTPDGEVKLRQVEERVLRENGATLQRQEVGSCTRSGVRSCIVYRQRLRHS